MSDEKNPEKTDAVSMDEYNKIVGAHNTLKTENEELKRKMNEIESKKVDESKKEWQRVMEEQKKEMEELKAKVMEQKDQIKVPKGVVPGTQQTETPTKETFKEKLDEAIPTSSIKNVQNLDPINRYGYYKSPTKAHSKQHLGMALQLDAGRFRTGQAQADLSPFAKARPDDTVVYINKRIFGSN